MANEITLQDLAMIVNIIDLVTKRGAFEGSELLVVGTVREKLAQTVNAEQQRLQAAKDADGVFAPEGAADETE